MKYYTELTDDEISGIGKSEITKDKDIVVTDIMIFKQTNSGASTTIEDGEQEKFFLELTKKNDKTKKNWNIWWHSHNTMSTFWSATDDATIQSHIGLQSYIISIVTNKKGEYKARLDIFPKDTSPFGQETFSTVPLDVEVMQSEPINKQRMKLEAIIEKAEDQLEELMEISVENPVIEKQCQKEIDEKVIKELVTYNTINYTDYSSKHNKHKSKKWHWWENKEENLFSDPYYAGSENYPMTERFSTTGMSKEERELYEMDDREWNKYITKYAD
jgi:hypothetical protein